ncbi:glycosyltransferase family 2 protein [Glaciibacter psychrotolerans]|uniref:Glycosyltransferase involved in cell wall biosynthesis n=1 Tax=Glaciibacter psychrotolerans TaxID=670054 RepID=A0A7Z0ECR8_9MICO|nr:glycosyltransferase family 2 protein [Leifsonia psychrotolerans]NYJ19093.1 glycosyltransferase involved in cell wall biosynthesis [Leifsonia psychrotolerans]
MRSPRVDVVLPCLNERDALPWVLSRIPAGYRAIVVDNGSTDGSAKVAQAAGATVVTEPCRGFGAAAQAGLAAASAPLVAFCDADASLDPAELPRLVELLMADEADLVLGRRRPTASGAWPPHARLANAILAARISQRIGSRLYDLGPLRAARTAELRQLALIDRRNGYPLEMVIRGAEAGWRIVESDVHYAPRVGRSKVTGTVRGTIAAVFDMGRVLGRL